MTTNRNSKRERTACEKTRDNRFPRWLTPARDDNRKSVIGTTEVVPFPISRNVVFFRSLRSRALPRGAEWESFHSLRSRALPRNGAEWESFRSLRSRALPRGGPNGSFLRSGFDPSRQMRHPCPVGSTAEGGCPYMICEWIAESSHLYVVCCRTAWAGCPYAVCHCALRACRARRCLG